MQFELMHRRDDGTFVVRYKGYPYHVIPTDPMYASVAAAASGADLPPEPVLVAEIPVPQSVSRFQMQEALMDTPSPDPRFPNALELINAAMAPRTDRPARAWREAGTVSRASPTVAAFAAQFGWTEQMLDDLFIRAAAIEA